MSASCLALAVSKTLFYLTSPNTCSILFLDHTESQIAVGKEEKPLSKVIAPLFSFSASGAIAESIVYFPWKGLNVVRKYVVPANPKSPAQTTQRGYLTEVVDKIHALQVLAVDPMIAIDTAAYALWGSIFATPRTWFNQAAKMHLDQRVATKHGCLYRDAALTPGANQVGVHLEFTKVTGANDVTAGTWYYGRSKTALINSKAATILVDSIDDIITGLVKGVKYYFQFRPTLHADYVGARSGIYHATSN